jgi:hypothetical protein
VIITDDAPVVGGGSAMPCRHENRAMTGTTYESRSMHGAAVRAEATLDTRTSSAADSVALDDDEPAQHGTRAARGDGERRECR